MTKRPIYSSIHSYVKNYGRGLYVSHGTPTQIYANKIEKNLRIHHNVTLGMVGEGHPEIGDNVYSGTLYWHGCGCFMRY